MVEKAIGLRTYYKNMKDVNTQKREKARETLNKLYKDIEVLYQDIKSNIEEYKKYDIDLTKYPEFVDNKYINGDFCKTAKGLFINKKGDYKLIGELHDLWRLAAKQKDIYSKEQEIAVYNKLLNLSFDEYSDILKKYYFEVQRKMVLDGCGYAFEGNIGWICINRSRFKTSKRKIDYAATRKRRKELKAEGKRTYNREEAEWCKKNGLKYEVEDDRVYQDIEFVYEIPLIDCKLSDARKLKFITANWVGTEYKKHTYDELLKEANYDKDKIMNLPLDIRKKLNLCLKLDNILYTKYIRNENQQSFTSAKINRKNR